MVQDLNAGIQILISLKPLPSVQKKRFPVSTRRWSLFPSCRSRPDTLMHDKWSEKEVERVTPTQSNIKNIWRSGAFYMNWSASDGQKVSLVQWKKRNCISDFECLTFWKIWEMLIIVRVMQSCKLLLKCIKLSNVYLLFILSLFHCRTRCLNHFYLEFISIFFSSLNFPKHISCL